MKKWALSKFRAARCMNCSAGGSLEIGTAPKSVLGGQEAVVDLARFMAQAGQVAEKTNQRPQRLKPHGKRAAYRSAEALRHPKARHPNQVQHRIFRKR
jgi:hypothetical protein